MNADRRDSTPLNPHSLSMEDAAQLLAKVSGEKITTAMIETDRTAGAPANPNGTIHLVNYAAWLVKEDESAN
jgi:hypothetical protein